MTRKRNVDQLSLLEKRPKWQDLPDDLRQLLAQLLSAKLKSVFNANSKEDSHVSR